MARRGKTPPFPPAAKARKIRANEIPASRRWALVLPPLAGCATNPITGRSQFILVSEEMAIRRLGRGLCPDGRPARQEEPDRDRYASAREKVREITDRLIAQAVRFRPDSASWNWEVQLINEPKTVNAFCMAGGKMGIYTGMWETLKATDDEIAAVMGHEIGHALASHTRERMSVAMGTERRHAGRGDRARVARQPGRERPDVHGTAARLGARHPAAQQPRGRERGRPDRHRARGARRLRPERRGHAVGKDGQDGRRQGPAGVSLHASLAAPTAPRACASSSRRSTRSTGRRRRAAVRRRPHSSPRRRPRTSAS